MLKFGNKTYIMGILNLTPDSFSDGGDFVQEEVAITHALDMEREGADIIDIGAESTRPGCSYVDEKTEIERLAPVLKRLSSSLRILISIDSYKAVVADYALSHGAAIINDVWGFQKDQDMAKVAAKYACPCVVMHNQEGTVYEGDIIDCLKNFFQKTIEIAVRAGVDKEKLILDPGIGFGKTADQNIEILKRLYELKEMGYPLLLGTSRKSTLGKILDLPPKERVEGTVATSVLGIWQGVDILRVHDVKENFRAAKVADAICRIS